MEKRGFIAAIMSRFSAALADPPVPKVKLNGGNYDAVDTGDGYTTVKRIPILSTMAKGTHGAPYEVTKEELVKFHDNMLARYQRNRAGGLSIGHNDDLGITHPDFAGFFIPAGVDEYDFPHEGRKWTLFADFKIPNDKFVLFAAGKLPWHSPEIYAAGWTHRKIELVSFLDSKPPYFDWENNTVGKVTKDEAARFEAIYDGPGSRFVDFERQLLENDPEKLFDKADLKKLASKFAAYAEEGDDKGDEPAAGKGPKKGKPNPRDKGDEDDAEGDEANASLDDGKDELFEKQFPEASRKLETIATTITKLAQHMGLDGRDTINKKPTPKPAEPGDDLGGDKMGLSPKEASDFAALQNDNAEIKAKFAAQELKDKVTALMAKADSILSRKVLANKDIIVKFATDAASMKDGDKWFTDFVENLKPSLRDKPPSSEAELIAAGRPSVEAGDPTLTKFAAQGANMDEVTKFVQDYRTIKKNLGDKFHCTEDAYVDNELAQAKARRENAELSGTRR